MAVSRKSPSPDLKTRVGRFLDARVARNARLTIGLSGGCDSMVLTHVVAALRPGSVSAIHVHHGLSPNADAWAAFCERYCQNANLPLEIRRVSVDSASDEGLEAAARRARYAVFAESASETLLLGQHQGDLAETVLFNLMRGAGVLGAAAIPAERRFGEIRVLRPLLEISRAEIEAYARQQGLRWIDDESNQDARFSRNFLRHQVIPSIEVRFPSVLARLGQAAANFSEAAAMLDELAAMDWQLVAEAESASIARLRGLSTPRIKNLLRYRLRVLGWRSPDARRLNEFVRQLLTAGPDRHPELCLPDGVMSVKYGLLRWKSG